MPEERSSRPQLPALLAGDPPKRPSPRHTPFREVIRSLMRDTDQVADIQNTLRVPTPVCLSRIEAVPI